MNRKKIIAAAAAGLAGILAGRVVYVAQQGPVTSAEYWYAGALLGPPDLVPRPQVAHYRARVAWWRRGAIERWAERSLFREARIPAPELSPAWASRNGSS